MATKKTDMPEEAGQPTNDPLAELAETLERLDAATLATHTGLRRLKKRLLTVNRTRHRIHPLANALVRLRHRELLAPLGVEDFDACEAGVETSYEGLLVAVVRAALAAGADIGALRAVAADGTQEVPSFAAEMLGLATVPQPGGPNAVALIADGEALVGDGSDMSVLDNAAVVIVLARGLFAKAVSASEVATAILAMSDSAGLEPVHVSGDGAHIVLASRGLLKVRRTDFLSQNRESEA